jgi:mRNA interferase RelE/StbE
LAVVAYEVSFEAKVLKAMRRFPDADQRRLLARIEALADEPRPPGAIKLTDAVGWRLRVGDYRVIYRIAEMEETIIITRVSQRGDVYRKR